MATITATQTNPSNNAGIALFTWASMFPTTSDVGSAVNVAGAKSITVSCTTNTVGVLGVITMQGSFDNGATWTTMQVPTGTSAIAAYGLAATGETVMQLIGSRPLWIRPATTTVGGTPAANYTIRMCVTF